MEIDRSHNSEIPQVASELCYAKLYMDPELHHSSGYFRSETLSLSEAQQSKVTTVLSKLDLSPTTKLVDVGCGWGGAARTAAKVYGADVVGITLSPLQAAHARNKAQLELSEAARVEFRCQRWEAFHEPVDRILCVNAFENFGDKRGFFPHCRRLLSKGGRMVVVTVTADRPIFRVVPKAALIDWARGAGFRVETSESLAVDYARTLEHYVTNLKANERYVIALVGDERYLADVRFYERSADFLRSGLNDMFEFTLTVN